MPGDNSFFSIDVPWGFILSLFLFVIVLFYFLFFQQYLTALIWRLFISVFIPKNIQINFKRIIFSFASGHVTMFDVTIITEDMAIHIDKLAGIVYYWRKIPDFTTSVGIKSRLYLDLYGLDITIYNRTWSTNLVESVKTQFESGKSTSEISQFILSQYPNPKPYQLSVLLRMILPLQIRIYSSSLTIGNPTMPAYLIFRAESISGYYTLIPKKSQEHSIQSYLDLDILTFSLKALPCTINETPWFKKSMRNIYNRSHRQHKIMKAEDIEIHILTDLYGLYVLATEEESISKVTQQPQMIIDATFLKKSTIYYGPYTDKLRRVFMDYFAPFVYNDTILYPEARKRIKYWVVNLNFPDGSTLKMPFEKEVEETNDINDEKTKGSLFIHIGKESKCQMYIPQYIDSYDDNKFELSSIFHDVEISTSIPGQTSTSAGPPIIHSPVMNLNVGYYYPERWNEQTKFNIFVNFEGAVVVLTPYHIDYLTQFGTDFSSYYPFSDGEETISTFCPYAYYLTISFEKSFIKLFTEPYPNYECFYDPDQFPQAEILADKFVFKLSLPLLIYNEKQKSVSFSADIDRAKVNFYLPENHLMRIRRGPHEDSMYDYVSMEKFKLLGSYRWSADEHGDCQIPVTMRISNVEGLITIGTLVTLIGTIANYTSRERKHPKVFNDPPQKTIFNFINNTSVVVSIDHGKVKVPLDLYEPNAGAIAHASGILIGVESYHPFWHVMVDIGCAVVELPRTDFPYDRYFNEHFQSENGPKEGTFHVEYIHITMKTISTFTGSNFVDLHTKIGCEIGNIDGFAVMPQLFCGLEIAWNIIHSFFGDDVSKIRTYDPFYIYKVEVFRICIGSIRVYLDMGEIGLVCAMLPGGVVVYSDTLIDENAHYVIFVHLPSIDAHILQLDQEKGKVRAIFRASTYLNVVRDIRFNNGKDDAMRQNQLLRMYDVIPHPERFIGGTKRNYYTYLFDFINKDKTQLSSEYFFIPEMMRPETYHSSLNEDYEIAYIFVTDSRNNNSYTLMIPEVRYPSYKKFINMEDGIQWLHHYETVRFYNRLSPSNRNMINIPPADPKLFATQYYAEDKFRARDSNGAIRLVLPNTVIAQLLPTALINASALLNAFNLFPNEELLAKVVRSTVGDEFDLKNYHSNTINVMLPQVKVLIHDDFYGISLSVNNVNIRYVSVLTKTLIEDAPEGKDKNVFVQFDKNLTLYIQSVSLECYDTSNKHPSIMALIPDICLVKANDKGAVKISPIKFFFGSTSPSLLNVIIKTLPKYLEDLTVPTIGDRCDELVRVIKADPRYKANLKIFKKKMYSPGECNTRFIVNCELSALYETLREMNLKDFTQLYKMVVIPSKPVSDSHSLMTVHLPSITLTIQTSSMHHSQINDPTLLLDFAPLTIESQKDITYLSCGIQSLKVSINNDIIRFIKDVIPTPLKGSPNQKKKKKKLKSKDTSKKIKSSKSSKSIKSIRSARSNSDLLYDYEYSYEKNTVADPDEFTDEIDNNDDNDDDNDEDIIDILNEEEVLKPSDVFTKVKEKPSDSKIFAHVVVNSINIGYSPLLVKLRNISLSGTVQPSRISDASFTASFTDFDVSINKWISIKLNGVALTHSGEIGEGFVHIKPIAIHLNLDFLMNAQDYVDLTIITEILGDMNNEEEENDDIYNPTVSTDVFDSIRSYKGKINPNNSNSTFSKTDLIDILSKMSTSLLIDPLSINIAISTHSRAQVSFPKAMGIMFSSEDKIHVLCYFQQSTFAAENYFSFPIPSFMFNLTIQQDLISAILMVSDIIAKGKSKVLSNAASLVNEILSKFDKPKKSNESETSNNVLLSPRSSRSTSPNKGKNRNSTNNIVSKDLEKPTSKLAVLFQFHLLKVEVKVEELSTTLTLNRILADVQSSNNAISWGFNVQEIKGEVFDSKIVTSVCGKKSKTKKKIRLTVSPLEAQISHNLFNKIPLFANFAIVIINGFKKQKHVNIFLSQLNDHIQQQAEIRADHILDTNESNKKLEFPYVLSNEIIFTIENVKIQLLLPPSGATVISVPEISLDVKIKNSPNHTKQAIGAKFQIQNFDVVFDTEESMISKAIVKKLTHSKRNEISSFHISKFVISALSFQNDIDFESIVDGITIKIFPTIPFSIAKLLLGLFALTVNVSKAKEKFTKNETSHSNSNSNLNPHQSSNLYQNSNPHKEPSTPSPRSRRKTLSIITIPMKELNNEILSPRKKSVKEKIITTVITCLFECKNTVINLSPIDNKLQIPSVEVRFMVNINNNNQKDNNVTVSLLIPSKIEASLTPALIEYLGSLKTYLPLLSQENQQRRQEEYAAQQKEQKQKLKQKQKQSDQKDNLVLSPTRSNHHRSKSSNYNIELLDEEDDDFDISKKLSFGIHIVFYSRNLEICFSCQPRRNDVSCLIGISGISAVASTQSKCLSVQIIDFYLHTHNMFAIQSADTKSSRLFQFNIPRIDALLSANKIMFNIENIFSSFSSDKVEEITLFNDIWFQPLIKMISSDNSEDNNNSSSNIALGTTKSEGKLYNESIKKLFSLNNDDSNSDDDDDNNTDIDTSSKSLLQIEDKESSSSSSSVSNLEIDVTIKTIELYFNYAAGHGNIDLILQPILITKTPELMYASINSISATSSGQLSCILNLDNIYFISNDSNHSLTNVVHLNDIKVSMSMAGDTFLLFSVSQINLLCRIKKEDTGNRNTILELSIDTPQIKMTALTVPTIKTLIKTIADPIINGVARANRSDSVIDGNRVNSMQLDDNSYKTAPAIFIDKPKQKPSTFSIKKELARHLLFAKLSVVIRDVRIVLLRYVFRDNDAVMFSIEAAMLHLDLKPVGKGMNRNLHFSFLPIALMRLTNNEVAPNATNPTGFQPISTESSKSSSSSLLNAEQKEGQNRKNKNSKSSKKSNKKNDEEKAKTRPILKIPQVNGTLDTQQKIVDLPDVTYNFYTEFFGNIEPTLNLSDYEMLLALIKYTIANVNLNRGDDYQRNKIDDDSDDESGIFGSISNSHHNSNNNSNNNNSNNSLGSKNKTTRDSKSTKDSKSSNNQKDSKSKEKVNDNMPKIHYNFTPLNYKFAPSFKVGYGASINPDITWLLARFGISDEHIIPASLFQFLCIGLENFLSALTNSMSKANQEEDKK